ncbi:ATP-binding cassette domain-containing protein [Sinanaerobacter sp. ZZT-01]|uniref:ATP-binding cassette domain-containing protein n=1 Tax=Sinanaerobacter sp. ZZT-01 TaxID=3111540 RepID=UPI002D790AB9|nr:ATP-binding cassette domain-containing protein [Sinanaerobacter sp. ZZT-01]WRR93768.1 ATP-binding cassette domain-containing protein [Sinanaerobacter sp. ZZT-01]
MLKINQLSVKEKSGRSLLEQVSIEIPSGTIVGLTGHSGSGKTTLLRSIFGMLHTDCKTEAGEIYMDDTDLLRLSPREHRGLCGKKIGFIPQNPITAFDSRLKIGYQIQETFQKQLKLTKSNAIALAKDKLDLVNLKEKQRVLNAYPLELSGGMLQRVAAAILLGMSPDYILADEPTAALDEENRNLLLDVLQTQMQDKGILFVSHDVDALQRLCNNVYVLGAGKVIEQGNMDQLLMKPQTDWMKQFASLSKKESRGEWEWRKLQYKM